MHAQRTCKATMCRPRAFSRLLCVLHADINKQEHTVWIRAQKKKTKGILWGLTAEEKVGCWRSQQLWTGGQWADKSKDPAKHQEDEAERQQNDHYFVQACKHTHLEKNINIYIFLNQRFSNWLPSSRVLLIFCSHCQYWNQLAETPLSSSPTVDSLLLHFMCQRCKQEVFLKTLTKLILSSKRSYKSTLGGKNPQSRHVNLQNVINCIAYLANADVLGFQSDL